MGHAASCDHFSIPPIREDQSGPGISNGSIRPPYGTAVYAEPYSTITACVPPALAGGHPRHSDRTNPPPAPPTEIEDSAWAPCPPCSSPSPPTASPSTPSTPP